MTNTILSTNDINAGVRFTYLAARDSLMITPGVTIASTTTFVLAGLNLSDLQLIVQVN